MLKSEPLRGTDDGCNNTRDQGDGDERKNPQILR
jgi:hypothetical protein